VENAGFSGYYEVEIFSNNYWKGDQSEFLGKIIAAYTGGGYKIKFNTIFKLKK
jgi:hypothetical protein